MRCVEERVCGSAELTVGAGGRSETAPEAERARRVVTSALRSTAALRLCGFQPPSPCGSQGGMCGVCSASEGRNGNEVKSGRGGGSRP